MNVFARVRVHFTRRTNEEYREINRLIMKAGRRCAYDLKHAAQAMGYLSQRLKDAGLADDWRCAEYERYSQRASMWQGIFNPGDDGKNYRDRLHHTIRDLENQIEKYQELLAKHGIPNHREIPF